MSITNPPSSTFPTVPGVRGEPREQSIKLVSHSNLFYWWPVWFLAFVMAAVTYFENHRLAVVPPHGKVSQNSDGSFRLEFPGRDGQPAATPSLARAVTLTETNQIAGKEEHAAFAPRISQQAWVGAVFVVGLLLTVVITNVPLRGLWSFLVLISILVIVLFISLLNGWDNIFLWFGDLRIHMNMATYLFIGVIVFAMWVVAVFVFDQRSYIIFTPGQIRYCEHIWDSVKVFPAAGAVIEKQRDDLFRHYVLGFFSGDLIVRTGTGQDRHELRLPNVLGLGFKLSKVEDMLRRVEVSQ